VCDGEEFGGEGEGAEGVKLVGHGGGKAESDPGFYVIITGNVRVIVVSEMPSRLAKSRNIYVDVGLLLIEMYMSSLILRRL